MDLNLINKNPQYRSVMNRISFLIVSVFLLAFCFCSELGFAQMKTGNTAGVGADFPETDSRIPRGSDNDPAIGNHSGVGVHFHFGPAILGVEGKYVSVDPSSKFGDAAKPNSAVIFDLGFHF